MPDARSSIVSHRSTASCAVRHTQQYAASVVGCWSLLVRLKHAGLGRGRGKRGGSSSEGAARGTPPAMRAADLRLPWRMHLAYGSTPASPFRLRRILRPRRTPQQSISMLLSDGKAAVAPARHPRLRAWHAQNTRPRHTQARMHAVQPKHAGEHVGSQKSSARGT
eukprot:3926329-Rhodomonas_salina.1